jgi:hypothetical protein
LEDNASGSSLTYGENSGSAVELQYGFNPEACLKVPFFSEIVIK